MPRENVVKTKSNTDTAEKTSENKHINAYSQDVQTEKIRKKSVEV